MNSFKQALNHLKTHWQNSIVLGITTTAFVFLARSSPWLSAFIISLGILIFQEIAQRLVTDNTWPRDIHFKNKGVLAYLVTALVLLPTSILLGSAIGILESPQDLIVSIPLTLSLLILALYFYLVLSQALRLHFDKSQNIAKAIDVVGLASIKNFKLYLAISFYGAVLILISGMTKGVGLVVALPFIFFMNHFAYLEMRERFIIARAPQ